MDDHSITELCIKELQACQKISTGPNFIVSETVSYSNKRHILSFMALS